MANELLDHLQDLLADTRWRGRARFRAMFGGHGMYLDGRMCAIVFGDALYLKTDAASRPRFVERGLGPFVYVMKGKPMPLSYYAAPAEALEDGAELADWLEEAWRTAGRKAAAKAAGSSARGRGARSSRPSPASSRRRK